jgi:hypothetical protein
MYKIINEIVEIKKWIKKMFYNNKIIKKINNYKMNAILIYLKFS